MTNTITPAEYRKAQRASKLELAFETQLKQLFMDNGWDTGAIVREYQFCEDRKWRADFAIHKATVRYPIRGVTWVPNIPSHILLIEIEGGTRQGGRHNKHDGMTNDCYKYGAASAMGYVVLRGTSQMVHDGTLLMMVDQVLRGETNYEDWKATT